MATLALAVLLIALPITAQDTLTVQANYKTEAWQDRRAPIDLALSRELRADEGTLAVFIDRTDITALFAREGTVLRYQTLGPPLPSGEHQLIVYLVDPSGQSREAARFPVKVLHVGGFEKATTRPSLEVLNKGQIGEGHRPATQAPPREEFQDFTLQGGLSTEHQRSDVSFRTAVNVTGVSYVNEALRFGEMGPDAPRIDLSNYRFDLQKGGATLSLGHLSFGNERHLINQFNSRGALLRLPLGKAMSIEFGAANGTSVVGWSNPSGLDNDQHRVLGLTLGVEARPSRPGLLRLEASLLDGSLLPVDNFNQGAIRSAETNRGGALRVTSQLLDGRVTFDAGFARSRFETAPDAQLEEGLDIVPLSEQSRDASYVEVSLDLIRNRAITKSQQMNARLSYQFERVDPLYRSVAAFSQADLSRQSVTLGGNLGPLMLQAGAVRMHDNLADIASILRTKTEQRTLTAGLPLASAFPAARRAFLLPVLNAQYAWTHQFGDGIPVDSGFNETHIPDQVSKSLTAGIEWQLTRWRFGSRYSLNQQDNRQPSRESSDFESSSQGIYVAFMFAPMFDVAYDVTRDIQESIEFATRDATNRHGLTLAWRPFGEFSISGSLSRAYGRDDARTKSDKSFDSYAEISQGFRLWRSGGQRPTHRIFLRYTNRDTSSVSGFGSAFESSGWTVTTGFNVKAF